MTILTQNPLNVVYIDDEPDLLTMFEEAFGNARCKVRTFSNPKLAIAEIKNSPPDLVFIDYRLPGMNGDQVAGTLDPKIPKVLISGDLLVTPKTQFMKVFGKPFDLAEVQNFINTFNKKN